MAYFSCFVIAGCRFTCGKKAFIHFRSVKSGFASTNMYARKLRKKKFVVVATDHYYSVSLLNILEFSHDLL